MDGHIVDRLLGILQKLIKGIIDCIENCMESMTFCVGRRVLKVFMLSGLMLGIALVCWVFDIWAFISWQEALSCLCISGGLSMVDATNRSKLTKLSQKLKGEQDDGRQ